MIVDILAEMPGHVDAHHRASSDFGVDAHLPTRLPCYGADRASATRRYPTRKGADFRQGLNGRDALDRLDFPGTLDGYSRTDR